MPTMEQLGNDINKTLSPSISGIATGSTTPTYTEGKQLLTTLEKDMKKLGSGIQKGIEALYKTSEYAHKLVAIDKAKQFELGSKKIDEFYLDKMQKGEALTSKDYETWLQWKTDFFDEMVTKKNLPNDAKEYSDYYKEYFIKPAVDQYYKDKAQLSQSYLAALKSEQVVEFQKEVEENGTAYTKNDYEYAVSQLDKLGVPDPDKIISTQIATTFNTQWHSIMYNGINSETFKPQLEAILSGEMTVDQAFRAKFNEVYGNQVMIDDKGNYVKVNKKLTDSAFNSMIKSYQGWINAFNKKGESPTLGSLIPQLNKAIDVNNTSSTEAKEAFVKATEEMNVLFTLCKAGNSKACNKFSSFENGDYINIKMKTKHIETLEAAYEEFNKNPSYIFNKEFSYGVTVTNPLTGKETSLSKNIDKKDVYNYISSRLTKNYTTAIKNGDVASANEVALKAKILLKDGDISSEVISRLSDSITALDKGEFAFNGIAENPKQFMAYLTSAVTFNQTGDGFRYSGSVWINDKMLSRVSGYYNDLIARKEKGEKGLTDDKITQLLIAYTNSERAKGSYTTLTEEQKATVNRAIGDAGASVTNFVEWYTAGKGQFGLGTPSVALKYVLSKDKVVTDEKAMKDELQKNLKVMDDKSVPIFTDRTVLFVPDKVLELGADKYKDLFYYSLNKDIQKYNDMSEEKINLRDLTDDNIQVRQTVVNGQVYTFVDIFDDNQRRLHTAEITEDEWLKALNYAEKYKIDNPEDSRVRRKTNPKIYSKIK